MRLHHVLTVLIACLICFISDASSISAAEPSSWKGYLVDRSCRASVEGDSNALSFVREHSKSCALMAACRQAGYAIYTTGKWLNFDKTGNDMAEKLLKASKKDKHFYVQVTGSLSGQTIVTHKITEIPEVDGNDK